MATLRPLDELLKIPCYKRYYNKKLSLIKKYPQYKEYGSSDYRNYVSGMGELITKDKDWQEFVWTMEPESERIQKEQKWNRKTKLSFNSYSTF